ncbi:hypothetical protein GN956_G14654 [Arapaima gigas]
MVFVLGQKADIEANIYVVSEDGTVTITCKAPSAPGGSSCNLYRNPEVSPYKTAASHGTICRFSVVGRDLAGAATDAGRYAHISLSCDSEGEDRLSTHSREIVVTVYRSLTASQLTSRAITRTHCDVTWRHVCAALVVLAALGLVIENFWSRRRGAPPSRGSHEDPTELKEIAHGDSKETVSTVPQ